MNIRSLVILLFIWMGTIGPSVAVPMNGESSVRITTRLSLIPGAKIYNHSFDAAQIEQLTKEGIKIGSSTKDNYLKVEKGNVLLSPDSDIIVSTCNGDVHISSGAVIFVMALDDNDVVLYDLRQSSATQVKVVVNDKDQIVMEPGYMIVLTRLGIRDFEELPPACRSIYYLEAEPIKMGDKQIKAFIAEFSYRSAMQKIQPLKAMIASDDKRDKMILDRILKTTVMLGDFTAPPSNGVQQMAAGTQNKQVSDKNPQL